MVDFDTILSCLIADCPYELYWSSKHSEIAYPNCVWSYSYDGGNVDTFFQFEDNANYVIKLSAAEDYRSAFGDEYQVDTEKTSAAAFAAERAKEVVAEFAGKSDYEKLLGYKNLYAERSPITNMRKTMPRIRSIMRRISGSSSMSLTMILIPMLSVKAIPRPFSTSVI